MNHSLLLHAGLRKTRWIVLIDSPKGAANSARISGLGAALRDFEVLIAPTGVDYFQIALDNGGDAHQIAL
jgi:hypothetical protein